MSGTAVPSLSRYDERAPIALLTDYAPDTDGGGAVLLRSLLGSDERRKVVWLSPSPPRDPTAAGPGAITLTSGSAGRGRRSAGLDGTIYAKALAGEAIEKAKGAGAKAFWVVLHGSAVAIGARLVRRGESPVHATVHDDPAFAEALRSRRYLGLIPWIERDFARALTGAASVDVIGEAMAARYRRRYGVESKVVQRALDAPVEPAGPYDAARLGLRVGVLGDTYSYEPLPRLAEAVESAAKTLGVPGRLLIVGRPHGERLREAFAGRVEVEVAGHVAEEDAIPLLRDCFALYLNYPFGRRDAVLRQTSFPTKLSTYVRAARPLLIHAPADSSTAPLLDRVGYAIPWQSPDSGPGAAALVSAWSLPDAFADRRAEASRVRLDYYDSDRNRRTLFGQLNALVPPPVS